jgi:esterase/lipase superfamily enzyme
VTGFIAGICGADVSPEMIEDMVKGDCLFAATGVTDGAMQRGVKFKGETMAFSWPSKANLLDYGYDRDSAMWSRDALEKVLDGLMASPTVGRLHIVAHSIGTMLTMEALRQLYAQLGGEAANRIGAVVFASPDIGYASATLRRSVQR